MLLDDSNYIEKQDPTNILGSLAGSLPGLTLDLDLSQEIKRIPGADKLIILESRQLGLANSLLNLACQTDLVSLNICDMTGPSANLTDQSLVVGEVDSFSKLPEDLQKRLVGLKQRLVLISFKADPELNKLFSNNQLIVVKSNTDNRFAKRIILFRILSGIYQIQLNKELVDLLGFLQEYAKKWRADSPYRDNPAKQTAYEIIGKTTIIYSDRKLDHLNRNFKFHLNCLARNLAWSGFYDSEDPEHEYLAWSNRSLSKPYAILELQTSFGNPRVNHQRPVLNRLLSGLRPRSQVIAAQGETSLQEVFFLVYLTDYISVYTAILNGVNPNPHGQLAKFRKNFG